MMIKTEEEIYYDLDKLLAALVEICGDSTQYAAFLMLKTLDSFGDYDLNELSKLMLAYYEMRGVNFREYQEEQESSGDGEAGGEGETRQ